MPKSLILCDCLGSQTLDAERLSATAAVTCSRVHSHLCGAEGVEAAARAIAAGDCIIACQQERSHFEDLAAEIDAEIPDFVDLRDRAGWSDDAESAAPKMAALLVDALRSEPPLPTTDVVSEGLCLILGSADVAIEAAQALAPLLGVTVLLAPGEAPPADRGFDTISGRIKSVEGALGGFSLRVDALQQVEPGGRGALAFGPPRDGARTECDIILDLRGPATAPLVPAPEKREGYLRADPGRPAAVHAAVLAASQLIGTFEKPLYLGLDPLICAHSRAQQEGCRKCLDICPTGAITPSGDHVDIDPMICAGCGSCAALCPSGAIRFDDPAPEVLFNRMRRLVEAYQAAGGDAPRLLVHDRDHGAEMISLAARFARGLPAAVIPMDLGRVSGFGHAEMLAALACGFRSVDVLLGPATERGALDREIVLAMALAGPGATLRLLEPGDPEALCDLLYGAEIGPAVARPILPLGNRRQVTRLAAAALNPGAEAPLPLPDAAPYGAVEVDTDACTLCLACAGLCPSGALGDNPDAPQLRFQEDACLQCGICAQVCPEDAIALAPRMDLSEAALQHRVLNEEEPFACVECGALFGVKSTIEKISARLEGKHSMFASSEAARLIRMCDDCRVKAQFKGRENPFASGEPPRVVTTDDYFSRRKDH